MHHLWRVVAGLVLAATMVSAAGAVDFSDPNTCTPRAQRTKDTREAVTKYQTEVGRLADTLDTALLSKVAKPATDKIMADAKAYMTAAIANIAYGVMQFDTYQQPTVSDRDRVRILLLNVAQTAVVQLQVQKGLRALKPDYDNLLAGDLDGMGLNAMTQLATHADCLMMSK